MLYMITEDSNSARTFWKYAIKVYRKQGTYKVMPLINGGGNTTLKTQINNVFRVIQPGDELFVVFDNIAKVHNFNTHDLINNTTKRCTQKGIRFTYTKYYCFEEIYLSYSSLLDMVNTKYTDVLKFVRDCINSGTEYFDKNNLDYRVINFLNNIKHSIKNKESFANDLLVFTTQTTQGSGWFKIHKSADAFTSSGKCWILGCSDIGKTLAEREMENVCNKKCKFDCKGCDTSEKFKHIDQNSLLANW